MNKNALSKLSKSQLVNLLMKQNIKIEKLSSQIEKLSSNKNIIEPPSEFKDGYKPTPAPRKSVKQMVQDYEDNIIPPPSEFKDDYKPIPKPRTKKEVPIPLQRTKIRQLATALKGYTKSFEIDIKHKKRPT